jgi:hypothetical protein
VPQRCQIGSGEAVPDLRLFEAGPADLHRRSDRIPGFASPFSSGLHPDPGIVVPRHDPFGSGEATPDLRLLDPEPAYPVCSRAGSDPRWGAIRRFGSRVEI